ncbi:MAG: bifunctional demethylmenaquinone methyltransferase/2-methoxy-6-polyprenyl-1,4-benzoquinol methylase UbiE, partial [Planctomycetota bacterium]
MPKPQDIAALFSSISPRYDFLNHFLSLNTDKIWRRRLINLSNTCPEAKILDICTGTGDIVIEFAKKSGSSQCFGVDISEKMLELAQKKVDKAGLSQKISLTQADAIDIPFDEGVFDTVFMGFGLRNIADTTKAIQETIRVLKRDGKIFILEFSPRQTGLIGWFYKFYLKFIIPTLGGWISGDSKAYRYLSTSIPDFLEPEKVLQLMKAQ